MLPFIGATAEIFECIIEQYGNFGVWQCGMVRQDYIVNILHTCE